MKRASTVVACTLLVTACVNAPHTPQFRSPSHDYPPPPRTTADGEVLGADRKPITDRLGEGRKPGKEVKR